jgi:hypothetical protein
MPYAGKEKIETASTNELTNCNYDEDCNRGKYCTTLMGFRA